MRNEKRTTCVKKWKNGYLHIWFARETDDHKEQDGDNVVIETGPIVNLEGRHESSHQHEEDRAGSQDCTTWISNILNILYNIKWKNFPTLLHLNIQWALTHQQDLIRDVRQRDIVVDLDCAFRVHQQIHDIRDRGGYPATPLVVELVESFRCVSISVARSWVFHLNMTIQMALKSVL